MLQDSDKRLLGLVETWLKKTDALAGLDAVISMQKKILRNKYSKISDEDFANVIERVGVELLIKKVSAYYASILTIKEVETLLLIARSEVGKKIYNRDHSAGLEKAVLDWVAETDFEIEKINQT